MVQFETGRRETDRKERFGLRMFSALVLCFGASVGVMALFFPS